MRTLLLFILPLCQFIGGCTTYTPVTLSVSDGDGIPVSGASVQAAPMFFFNPTDANYIIVGPYDILEPFPAKGSTGTTGDDGRVLLEIVTDSPLELNVFAENQETWHGQLSISAQGDVEISEYENDSAMVVTSD